MEKSYPKCKQCDGGHGLERVDGIFALMQVEKNIKTGGVMFVPKTGMPVVVYICPNCGELRLYPAKLFGEI